MRGGREASDSGRSSWWLTLSTKRFDEVGEDGLTVAGGKGANPGKVSRASASRAATAKHSSVARELREIRDLIWELLGLTIADRLPHRARRELQTIVQLLQCYLRAAELEMRAAEEPLRSDLDAAGLKVQVLGRIEELEAREREREEMLAELVPAMDARAHVARIHS